MLDREARLGKRVREWFWRRQALLAAQGLLPRPDEPAARAFEQARLLRRIARQVADPLDGPGTGSRAAVLLSLHRDLVYWTLVAAQADATAADGDDLAAVWARAHSGRLERAAGDPERLATVRHLLLETRPVPPLDLNPDDAASVQAFAEALYDDVAMPRRQAARTIAQRWLRTGPLTIGALALAAYGVWLVAVGPNLADRAQMTVSSQWVTCASDPGCMAALFHTNVENQPWVRFDLGEPKPIHVIRVRNRLDCCHDRAVPLIAEISTDGIRWTQVGRQDQEFLSWSATFPRTAARYVRLRVQKPATIFHLANVVIR